MYEFIRTIACVHAHDSHIIFRSVYPIRNESLSDTYTTDVIANIIKTEGQGLFDCRTCILGHIQQGSTPSPLDRIRATRLAVKCVNFLERHAALNLTSGDEKDRLLEENAVVIGISGAHIVFTVCYHMNVR